MLSSTTRTRPCTSSDATEPERAAPRETGGERWVDPRTGSVRSMNDGRRRRKAKQTRRDARRSKTGGAQTRAQTPGQTPEEAPLLDGVRQALSTGHPLDLLCMASLLIEATKPDPLAFVKSGEQREQVDRDRLVESFIGVQVRETTALLTVFAELLDDEDLRLRCRREAAARLDDLPGWLTDLPRVEAYRAVRMTHVLGGGDEVLIGARFTNGDELTCVAVIDHDTMSAVTDAFFVPGPIDNVVSVAAQSNTDPDRNFVDMSLADARAWIQQGPDDPLLWAESDSWPGCRPLLVWLIGQLPQGGTKYQSPESDSHAQSGEPAAEAGRAAGHDPELRW